MDLQKRIRSIGLDIIDSYEKRIKLVNLLISEAVRHVNDYCGEQEELSGQLKENLARYEGMRKKDYDALMENVLARRTEREIETRQTLEKLWQEEIEMINLLRKALSDGYDLAEFEKIKDDMLLRHRERENEVARSLMKFHLEQEELSAVLKKLVAKGEKVRVKDVKALVKTFGKPVREISDEIDTILVEVGRIRQEVSSQWAGVFSFYQKPYQQA